MRQYLWTVSKIEEWLYYNFGRWKSSQNNSVADFIRLKFNYIKKTKKSLFEPPFVRLRGNVRTPSMARWKARGRLYIRRN